MNAAEHRDSMPTVMMQPLPPGPRNGLRLWRMPPRADDGEQLSLFLRRFRQFVLTGPGSEVGSISGRSVAGISCRCSDLQDLPTAGLVRSHGVKMGRSGAAGGTPAGESEQGVFVHVRYPPLKGNGLLAFIVAVMLALFQRAAFAQDQTQIPSTVEDFFEPGTQELTLTDLLAHPNQCRSCHDFEPDGNELEVVPPYANWVTSMMAQAARDPVWKAAMAIANQDAANAGDTCIRCHSPGGWLGGRSVPTDGSALTSQDREGIYCSFCHRLVDPVSRPGNPVEDGPILAALANAGLLPPQPGNARYVVDPHDVRRGPLSDVPANYHGVPIIVSPFHRSGHLCGTCHDVSNPMYTRQRNGTYVLNAVDSAHPTGNPADMMPEQRTYSEWLNSSFANGGVYFPDHRFGGEHPTYVMQSCQDCHMPKHSGGLCTFWEEPPFFMRPDIAEHSFVGANTWVLGAIYDEFGQSGSNLTPESVALASQRTTNFLRAASDMQLVQIAGEVKVRIINQTGHKLPTGYPEGRRMWLNVKFYDNKQQLIGERGGYDTALAQLSAGNTKVYEARYGIDAATATATNLPQGESFHLVLNNQTLKDNRIPPRGFTNSAFAAIQASPVAASYADGQYWDDSFFAIPRGARQAVVTLYYQTTSKEYIEFLRDANVTVGSTAGDNAYNRWVARGKSAPVEMDSLTLNLGPPRVGDLDHNGSINTDDLIQVVTGWGSCAAPNLCPGDANGDNVINTDDLILVVVNWG